MDELRILNGLHRGATLPLSGQEITIGSSEDADVVLVDDDIVACHAKLNKAESGWTLCADQGDVYDGKSSAQKSIVELALGDFGRVGDIWITVVEHDAKWEKHPARSVEEHLETGETDMASLSPSPTDTAMSSPAAFVHSDTFQKTHHLRKKNERYTLIGALVGTIALSAAAAYAMTTQQVNNNHLNLNKYAEAGITPSLEIGKTSERHLSGEDQSTKHMEKKKLSPDLLKKIFTKRLADTELLDKMDLNLNQDVWNIKADLSDDESERFERILQSFEQGYQVNFPIHAKVVGAETMLPFEIHQVISGTDASVVTKDGQRLFVGDEYLGIKVLAIQENHLVFLGKRKFELDW